MDARARCIDTDHVAPVLRSSGQPLGESTRAQMEDRLGFDFSGVRVHADAEAAHSARAVGARAYTIGSDVVFGAGEYAPRSREGQRLIAHELTHVRQQASAPPMLQRWSLGDEIAGWFAGDTFDPKTLTQYITDLGTSGKIEDHSDSDNKARAVVAAWKKDKTAFALNATLKALLIEEMRAGFCGTDDELAILDLLTSASDDELTEMFTTGGLTAKSLNSALDFGENDKLMDFFAARFDGGFEGAKKQPVVKSGGAQKAKAATTGKATPEKPRLDYVFIMGEDSARAKKVNPFYTEAEKYFKVHYPKAEMITSERTLDGVLEYIERRIEAPIGHLYIVSHGNQDGTLQFGFDEGDTGARPQEAEEPARRLSSQSDGGPRRAPSARGRQEHAARCQRQDRRQDHDSHPRLRSRPEQGVRQPDRRGVRRQGTGDCVDARTGLRHQQRAGQAGARQGEEGHRGLRADAAAGRCGDQGQGEEEDGHAGAREGAQGSSSAHRSEAERPEGRHR